jgi:RNA polymerase sigma-70 factor (ECF subfamily)
MNWLALSGSRALCARTPEGGAAAGCPGIAETLTETALQECYLPRVFAYVSRRIGPVEEAEDITAEVFAAAFTALARRRAGSMQAWLVGIARRKVADALRRRGRRREAPLADLPESALAAPGEGPETALQRDEALRVLRAIVAGLKEEQREALLLKYVDGLAVAEIAVILRRSPAAVNSLLQRARTAVYKQGHAYFLMDDEVAG